MNSRHGAAVVAIMVIILIVNPVLLATGNPPPGKWEKVAETKPGEWMQIYEEDGIQHNYRFMSLNDEFLTCKNEFNEEVKIEVSAIREIVLENSGRYSKQGALVGALGGAAGGLALMGIGSSFNTESVLFFAGITAALGAAAGYIIGAAASASGETIYISKEAALAK